MMPRSLLALAFVLLSVSTAVAQQEAPRTHVEWRSQQLSDVFFSEGAAAGDFNRDGHMDVVSGPFWYEGPDFKKAHPFYEPKPFDPHGYSNNFFAFTDDFNGDGWTDILVYGFPGQDASWFENPQGAETLWPRHKVLDVVDNESPTFVDITGDGRRDIVCSSGGYFGYAEVPRDDPTAPWTFRRISDNSAGGRFTHGLGVGDVNGDGRMDLLEKTGWWEQLESLEGDPQWTKHPFPFSGPGGAQMFAWDIDGDGDNDVLTSLAAHGYGLAWFENLDGAGTEFRKHDILGSKPEDNPYGVVFSQLHGLDVADIDGDGLLDIVAGKRWWAHGPRGDAEPNAAPVLYWFRLTRGEVASDEDTKQSAADLVEFVPYLIHDSSGVGTEVKAVDLNGDGRLDIVVGNKRGTFVHIQSVREVSELEWRRHQPRHERDRAHPTSTGLPTHDGLDPEKAAKAMTVPKGFRVQLAAGEPLVHQPVAFTIDERGRLWVAEAHTYPRRAPEGEGQDRIIILEDKDLDGHFEHRKVFIEGLNLVSGLEVGFGGVWVGAAPYLMFIPDRDRDDVPDGPPEDAAEGTAASRKSDVPPGATVLLDGWGYQDTHETLNSLIWGPDGWLYGCQGVFTHSRVGKPGTPDDERTPLNCCVWRYHPIRHDFEVFAEGTSNPWGVDFDDYGQAFITACVIPHLYHMIQGGRYQRQGGQHFNPHTYADIKTIADHAHFAGNIRDHAWWGRNEAVDHDDTHAAGGGHAHAGAMIYLGDNWPTSFRNTIFMANIHGNRINNDLLRRTGSGYVASHGQDFLFANDRWFRGINLKYGPDGSVYVIDWYDPNACHRVQPEIWDRTNGRIYRISYGDVPPRPVDLSKATPGELADYQLHENDWYVRTARRLLQEGYHARSRSPREDDPTDDDFAFNQVEGRLYYQFLTAPDVPRRLRALWAAHAMTGRLPDAFQGTDLSTAGPDSEYIRAWQIQLELEDGEAPEPVLDDFAELASTTTSPVVRLYLASGLQRLPLDQRWEIAERLLQHGDDNHDHNLPLMYWYAVEPLVPHNPERALAMAARSKIPLVSQFIYRRAAAEESTLPLLLGAIGDASGPQRKVMLGEVMNVVKTSGRLPMPKNWPVVYAQLSASDDDDIRLQAQFITVKFGDKSIFPALREIATDVDASPDARRSALEALVGGRDDQLPPLLITLLDDDVLRSAAVRALAAFEFAETPAALVSRYRNFDEETRRDAVATLAARSSTALSLLEAIESRKIPREDLRAFTVAQMQQLGDEKLLAKLNEVWGSARSTPEEKLAQIAAYKQRLGGTVLAQADLSRGRAVYKKTCASCHKLFGEGGEIGPDITGSNRANLDYILHNVLDPSAIVGKDYQVTTIVTSDGRVIHGLVKEENDTAVVLQTATEQVVVDKAEIDVRRLSELSLMPEGQLQEMTDEEVRDLIAYLAAPSQVPLPGEGPVYNEATRRVLGALEGESLRVISASNGSARSQPMGNFSAGRWSGDSQLWWTGGKPGSRLVLEFPVKEPGTYDVFAVMTKARDYGIVRLSINCQPAGQPLDLYNSPDVITTGVVSLGRHPFEGGSQRLEVEITGANQSAVNAYMFGLDYLYLGTSAEDQ